MTARTDLRTSMPKQLESPRAKLVYLYLATAGETTVTELQQTLGMSKLALFSILESLAEQNVVRETEGGYACK